MPDLPTGTVTLLFTDIEHSTQLLQHLGPRYGDVLAEYRALLRSIFQQYGGHEVDTQGDSFFVAFSRVADAVKAAVAIQQALASHPWPEGVTLATRMGLHTGEPQRGGEGYVGLDVHRAARIGAAGHGGQVLLSQATHALIADDLPDGISVRDLGEHRLKDLRRPKHLFQLLIAGLPADFPALRALDARPNNLPVQRDPLIGRERELAQVLALLQRAEVGLVTLTGPGGTGKTRLALQVAAEAVEAYADGVWFVELAPLADPALVPSAIAQVLGVNEGGGPLLARLKTALRDKQLLLVLDNFEHVVAAAPIVSELLAAALQVNALVTSQSLLHLYAEYQFPVPPLAHPDLAQLPALGLLSRYPAVDLFVQRARAVKPDFAVTGANAAAVAGICARLDGMPLAIELAAARVRIFAPQAILTRLGQLLTTLTGGARDRPARHQSLRSTIDWSYQLLDPSEQRLFARLAVFAGGCAPDAAETVCAEPDDVAASVLDGLVSLVDKSLVRQHDGADGEPRFLLLESLREYALERLEASGEAATLRERHARYYLARLEALSTHYTWEQRGTRLDRLRPEMSNLAATAQWIRDAGDVELAVRWYDAAQWFRSIMNLGSVGYAWGRWHQALMDSRETLPVHVRAKGLSRIGRFAWTCGNLSQAAAILEEALALTRMLDDPYELVQVLVLTGDAYRDQELYARAVPLYEEFLARAQALGYLPAIAAGYHVMGELALLQEDYPRVLALEQASLARFRILDVDWGIPVSLINTGFAALHLGDDARAAQCFAESLSVAQIRTMPDHILGCVVGLAALAAHQRRAQRAARLLGAAEALQEVDGLHVAHLYRREYERTIAPARAGLDAVAWDAAWAAGRAMRLEEAITYALEEVADG